MSTKTEEAPSPAAAEKQTRLFLLALVLVSVLQYSYSFGNGFVWDAKGVFLEDPSIRELKYLPGFFTGVSALGDPSQHSAPAGTSVTRIPYYRPLMKVLHLAEYAAFGTNPIPYNAVDIFLNALVVALCFLVVRSVTGKPEVAFLASLLYAVNPARAEVVSWSYSDSYIVGAVFSLSALLFYHRKRYLLSALSFGFALLSHETAVLVPCILLLYEYLVRGERRLAPLRRLSVFFALTGLFLLLRRSVAGPVPVTDLGPFAFANAAVVLLARYVKIFFLPDAPVTIYQYRPGMFAAISREVMLSYAAALLMAALGLFLWRRKRHLLFWYLWFFVFISVSLNVGRFGDYLMAEKMLYVASLGLCVVIADLAGAFGKKRLGAAFVALLAVIQFGVTLHRTLFWTDTKTYLNKALEFAPGFYLGHYALAGEYWEQKEYDRAISEYKKTLELKPDLRFVSGYISDLHNEKGYEYASSGRYAEAIKEYEESLAIRPSQSAVYNNLGNIYSLRGFDGEALKSWQKAVAIDPANYEATFNLALACEKGGDRASALKYYRACLGISPQAPTELLEKVRQLQQGGRR